MIGRGWLDITLVALCLGAVVVRTPVGVLGRSVAERIYTGSWPDIDPTSRFERLIHEVVVPGTPAEGPFPEPWRTAVAKALERPGAWRGRPPELATEEALLARLDALWAGSPEAAIEGLLVDPATRERAVARARAAGDGNPEDPLVHGRFLPQEVEGTLRGVLEAVAPVAVVLSLSWPVDRPHRITSPWGRRKNPFTGETGAWHNGADLGVPIGTPVRSAQAGTVTAVREDDRSGRYAVIDHGHGVKTVYCHLDSVDVAVGTVLERGQWFAKSGNSGRSTGPHLHFIVKVYDKSVDPLRFGGPPPKVETGS